MAGSNAEAFPAGAQPIALSGVYAAGSTRPASDWGLVCFAAGAATVPLALADGMLVGSGPEAHVRVGRASLAPLHARFEVRAGGVYVHDLGAEATWVQGVRARRMPLSHGDVLRLGRLLSIFVERDLSAHCGAPESLGDVVYGPRQRPWVRAALELAASASCFAIEGGPGVGKAALARAALARARPGDRTRVVDGCTPHAGAQVCDALAGRSGTMVLLHAERLARAAQAELVRALRGAPGPRLVATIGRTLESAVAEGQLVPALASALAGRRVSVPSLEARREDAVAIAAALAERSALPRARLTLEVLELVARGAWPGGIRQLAEVLAQTLRPRGTDPADAVRARLGRGVAGTPLPLSEADPDLARCKIERAIDCSDGTVAGVARELGLSRQALYREARRLGAALPQRRRAERAHAVPER